MIKRLAWLLMGAAALSACSGDAVPGFRLIAGPQRASPGAQVEPRVTAGPVQPATTPATASPGVLQPDAASPLIVEGYRRLEGGDAAGARQAFSAHIQQNGGSALAYLGRARALLALDSLEAAVSDYTAAINADPKLVEAYAGRAESLLRLQHLAEALGDYDQVIRLRPNDANAYSGRARTFLAMEQPDRAVADINRAIAIEGDRAVSLFILGLAQSQQSDFASALRSHSRALDLARAEGLNPQFVGAVLGNRAAAHYELKEYAEALDDFARALQTGGPDPILYHQRAMVYYSQKKYSEAAADYLRALAIEPENAIYRNNLADARMLEGNLQQALDEINTALRHDPELGIAHYTKGEILEKMGRAEEARKSFARADELGFKLEPSPPPSKSTS